MAVRNRTADILYNQMALTTPTQTARSALKLMSAIQCIPTSEQLLGLAASLICVLKRYNLDHVEVLGMADNMVFSGENFDMKPEFKALSRFMKDEWEI